MKISIAEPAEFLESRAGICTCNLPESLDIVCHKVCYELETNQNLIRLENSNKSIYVIEFKPSASQSSLFLLKVAHYLSWALRFSVYMFCNIYINVIWGVLWFALLYRTFLTHYIQHISYFLCFTFKLKCIYLGSTSG